MSLFLLTIALIIWVLNTCLQLWFLGTHRISQYLAYNSNNLVGLVMQLSTIVPYNPISALHSQTAGLLGVPRIYLKVKWEAGYS